MTEEKKEERKENIDLEETQKESSREVKVLYSLYYITLIIIWYYLKGTKQTKYIQVGDFGGVVPMLFMGISEMVIRWLPILGVVGIMMTIKKKYVEDIYRLYMLTTIIMLVVVLVTEWVLR